MTTSTTFKPCPCCGSTNLVEYNPYGIESVRCGDCHVSLRKVDWLRLLPVQQPMSALDQQINNDMRMFFMRYGTTS